MNKFVAIGLGAAAVIVALFIGSQLLGQPNVIGPPAETPSPNASSGPSASPSGPKDFTAHEGEGAELVPGQYLITTAPPVRVTITVPDEPFGSQPSAWYKAMFNWGPWHQSNLAWLGMVDVMNLYSDPCSQPQSDLRDPPVGPTVDDLAAALATIPGVSTSTPVDAALDGYAGLLMELTGTASCAPNSALWTTTDPEFSLPVPDPGDRTRVWILEVEGNRLVIFATEDANFTDPESLQSLVDSIQIEL